MRRNRDGDHSSGTADDDLAAFVTARGPAMLRLAWLLTTDGPAAEDLLQDALTRVIPRWGSITPGSREAYLRRTIRSTWVDTWRRRKARGGWDAIDPAGFQDEGRNGRSDAGVEGTPDRLTLGEALARLTPRQRAVLVLRFYEDQTERETAAVLRCSVSTVKSQTRDALARLRVLAPELAEAFGLPPVGGWTEPGRGGTGTSDPDGASLRFAVLNPSPPGRNNLPGRDSIDYARPVWRDAR